MATFNHISFRSQGLNYRTKNNRCIKSILLSVISITLVLASIQPRQVDALWLFQGITNHSLDLSTFSQPTTQVQQQLDASSPVTSQKTTSYSSYGTNLLSIAGIQPSSIATILNTVGDTGFRYFNIQDQCRNRAACDLGSMLYRKLSFVHNWLIRTSVRTLTDMNNVYTQSWMEGMLGRNCTSVYMSCSQSPLDGLMNLALLQHLAL